MTTEIENKTVINDVLPDPYFTDYYFWASDSGRVQTKKIQKYKSHIVFLYYCMGILAATCITLTFYICNLINRGL